MRPNVLKSLYICEYHAGISGSKQKTSSLSESIDKNTSAEKQSGKENWVRFPRHYGVQWVQIST